MSSTETTIRRALAVTWCLLVTSAFFLSQFDVVGVGADPAADPLLQRMEWVYGILAVVAILIALLDLRRGMTRLTRTPGGPT
jgi:hypothetical protein